MYNTFKMVGNNEADEGTCYTYRAIYCDEIIALVKFAGSIVGKRNEKRKSAILGIVEGIEGRMKGGDCNREICKVADLCPKEDL